METTLPADGADLILWDVVEEHLDEAEFLFGQWSRALDSPVLTLDVVEKGVESRLLAHIDGLVVNGPLVVERLLAPALLAPEEPSERRATAAALGLLGLGRQDLVVQALMEGDEVSAAGAQRALELAAPASFDAWLVKAIASAREEHRRVRLLRVAAGRGVVIENLLFPLQSSQIEEAAAAARAARWADRGRHLAVIEYLIEHSDQTVADASLVTALIYGSQRAYKHCVARASSASRPDALAMLLVALLGTPRQHEVLVGHLARPSHRAAALFALGYSGQAAVVPALLSCLADEDARIAKLALQAVGVITGLDTAADEFCVSAREEESEELPPLEDDLSQELVPPELDALSLPNVAAIEAWWTRQSMRDARQRILLGERWTWETALGAMARLPLASRHALSMWLSIGSGGVARLETRAFAQIQRAQLARVSAPGGRMHVNRFGGF